MKRMFTTLAMAALVATGCSTGGAAGESTTAPPSTVPTTAAQTTPAPAPTTSAATDYSAVPKRAEMTPEARAVAEKYFLKWARGGDVPESIDDARLTDAGDAACDSFDRGDSLRAALIVAAGLLPDAENTSQIGAVVGSAIQSLCPEHAAYAD